MGSIDSPLTLHRVVTVCKALPSPLRKSALPPRGRFQEDRHPRDRGRFSSAPGAGGGAGKPGGSAAPAGAAPQQHTRPGILAHLASVAGKAEELEGSVRDWFARQSARLPEKVRQPVLGFLRLSTASYRLAQEAVDAVAAERGLSPEHRQRLGRIVSLVDLVGGGKLFPAALNAAGAGGFALAGSFVPVGSLGYLAWSSAVAPARVYAVASRAVRAKLGIAKSLEDGTPDLAALIAALADRQPSDAWFACFAEALDATQGDVAKSLTVADEASKGMEAPGQLTKSIATPFSESQHPRDDAGRFSEATSAMLAAHPDPATTPGRAAAMTHRLLHERQRLRPPPVDESKRPAHARRAIEEVASSATDLGFFQHFANHAATAAAAHPEGPAAIEAAKAAATQEHAAALANAQAHIHQLPPARQLRARVDLERARHGEGREEQARVIAAQLPADFAAQKASLTRDQWAYLADHLGAPDGEHRGEPFWRLPGDSLLARRGSGFALIPNAPLGKRLAIPTPLTAP